MSKIAPPVPSPFGPVALCDLMLAAPIVARVGCTTLEPSGDGHALTFRRGAFVVRSVRVDDEAAAAAVVRLATAAGLDPLPERGGVNNVARVRVRSGAREAEVLVSIETSGQGYDVEVRALTVDGREPSMSARAALRRCAKCGALQPGHLDRCEHDEGALVDVADDARPGGTIGPYRIESILGVGGMGRVYAASHALLGREVAIKLMHQSLGRATKAERRFLFEARAASRLRHPALVEVLDFGVLSDGRPYMVMERIRGRSLLERLASGPLPILDVLRIGASIAEALGAAHEGGVVHNDLKPSNVFLLDDRVGDRAPLKLIDFGAASLREKPERTEGIVVGTPSYIAPERIRGAVGDLRSDLYALGILMFELFTGAPPFRADQPKDVLRAHLNAEPPALTSPHGALPRGAGQVVARALRKSPDERYQSASEMRADLERAIAAAERPSWRRWLP